MALWRLRTRVRSVCPACDTVLDPRQHEVLAACPACGQALVPVAVAPHWRRLAAGLVDAALLLVTAGLLNWAMLRLVDAPPLVPPTRGYDLVLRVFEVAPVSVVRRVAPFLVMTALYLGLFWSLTGRTPGARLLGLRVIDRRGRVPHPILAAIRVAVHFIGAAPGALGWLWALFDRERRAWHDHLSRTYVVTDA